MLRHQPTEHPMPEHADRLVEVSRYRVVVEVSLYDRPEPLAGLAHGIMHPLTELLFNLPQLRSACVCGSSCAVTVNRPNLFFPLMCVKPRKSNVSGFPSPRTFPVLFGKSAELDPARLIWV